MTKRRFSKATPGRAWRLTIACLAAAAPVAAGSIRVYVTNHAGTTISVVDPASNKVVQEIKDIEVPEAVHFSPDGNRAYITQGAVNVLTVLDRKTGKEIKQVPISGHANDMAVTNDGKSVVICIAQRPGALDIIDTKTLEKVKSIPTRDRLHDVVISGDDRYAFATSPRGKFLVAFDLRTQEIIWEVQFDQDVLVPAVENGPDGAPRRIFVELNRLKGFAVIDFAQRKEVARITLPSDKPETIPSGPPTHGLAIDPQGKTLWVISRIYDAAFVYSLPELQFQGRVDLPELRPEGHDAMGGSPNWVTFTPDGKTAFIANGADNSVTNVDTKTLKPVARIPLGQEPGRMGAVAIGAGGAAASKD
jgi:YVTN family beta-propeller protein